MAGFAELARDLRTQLITARADTGTDSRMQVGGARAELASHGFRRPSRNLERGAAPAGVNGSHSVICSIHQENRKAVGSLYRHDIAIGKQRVALTEAT